MDQNAVTDTDVLSVYLVLIVQYGPFHNCAGEVHRIEHSCRGERACTSHGDFDIYYSGHLFFRGKLEGYGPSWSL